MAARSTSKSSIMNGRRIKDKRAAMLRIGRAGQPCLGDVGALADIAGIITGTAGTTITTHPT